MVLFILAIPSQVLQKGIHQKISSISVMNKSMYQEGNVFDSQVKNSFQILPQIWQSKGYAIPVQSAILSGLFLPPHFSIWPPNP